MKKELNDKREVGRILWFRENAEYGLVEDHAGVQYYIDLSVIPKRQVLKRNKLISFIPNKLACGRLTVKSVVLL